MKIIKQLPSFFPSIRLNTIIILITSIFCVKVNGQTLPTVIPPSPQTREFDKYINYNVSMYNGLPEISIPLYTIQVKGVNIPISLSYHASGVKFKQDNGEVGVGWTFNPGYRVSRTIYGFADEEQVMPASFDSVAYYSYDYAKRDKYLSRFLPNDDGNSRPTSWGDQHLDGEYDQFNFSIPSESGSFIISDRATKAIASIEKSNVKIDYSLASSSGLSVSGITGLKLTDESGNDYFFGDQLSAANNWVFEKNSSSSMTAATAWGLTDIKTPSGDGVHFKYNMGTSGGWMPHVKTATFAERVDGEAFIASHFSWTDGEDGTYNTFFLNEITSTKEKVIMTRNGNNMITHLEVRTADNALVKKVTFFYGSNVYHTFLDSLQISDSNSAVIQTYRFDYYSRNESALTKGADQWGYYQEVVGNPYTHLFHQEFFDDPIYHATPQLNSTIAELFDEAAPRAQITGAPSYFSLSKITYPTGGSTEYLYESNKYYEYGIKEGGGLRIQSIIDYPFLYSPQTITRNYVYGTNENGYGKVHIYLNHTVFVNETLRLHHYSNQIVPQRVVNYSTQVQGDLDLGGSLSSHVIYPSVTEYYNYSNYNPTSLAENGKTIYNYDIGNQFLTSQLSAIGIYIIPNSQYRGHSPQYVHRYTYWNKPVLTEKSIYSYANNQYNILKKETYAYQLTGNGEYKGLKVRPLATIDSYIPVELHPIPSFFDFGEYTIDVGKKLLTSKTDTIYNSGNTLSSGTSFEYNSLNQVIKETNYNSKGEAFSKRELHPIDMVSANRDPGGVYQAMVNKNMINPVIEEVQLKGTTQLSLVRNNYYNPHTGIYVPQSVETQKGSNPPELRLNYHAYDNKGNILSVSKTDGQKICYIWSYNGQYPVAEIKNADYAAVETILGASNIANFNAQSPNKASIDNFLAPLFTALPDARISKYVYSPLLGITTITDPRDQATTYEYDTFQRLQNVKDHNGNIIKNYDYHYKP